MALARELERRHPDLVTANWWKEERGERIFVDFNQNAPHKTVFGAWFARPRVGGQVSTPLPWDEVDTVDPEALTIRHRSGPRPPERAIRGPASPTSRSRSQPLLDLAAQDRADGLHDAPWPPEYPKQPDEPTRVAPSRAKGSERGPDPVAALRRIAYLLERDGAESYKVRAFRNAAAAIDEHRARGAGRDDLGPAPAIPHVGKTSAQVIVEAVQGRMPGLPARPRVGGPARADAGPPPSCADGCRATATATPTGPTAAARSARWPRRPRRSATGTGRSPTTAPG